MTLLLVGVDFSSNPSRRKPITVATGRLLGDGGHAVLSFEAMLELHTLDAFDDWLRTPGPWLGAFDFPFGLPRAFVDANALGATAAEVIAEVHRRAPTRMAWRGLIDAWGNTQPAGARLLHRRTDLASPVGSTSPLQTRYVPVGLMYYEGVARLVASGVSMPGLHEGDADRVALEGYPRRLAHAVVARRSYKNADDDDRRGAREAIVESLEGGVSGLPRLDTGERPLRDSLLADASGDRLDAVLCLMQAARASGLDRQGLPGDVDPVEGWIVSP